MYAVFARKSYLRNMVSWRYTINGICNTDNVYNNIEFFPFASRISVILKINPDDGSPAKDNPFLNSVEVCYCFRHHSEASSEIPTNLSRCSECRIHRVFPAS